MNYKLLTFLLVCFLFNGSISAQKSDVEIIDFGDDNDTKSDYVASNYIIKTSPVSFVFGSQMIEVERYMTDFLSVQAGIGLTFDVLYKDILDEDITSEIGLSQYSDYCESEFWGEQNDICDDFVSTFNRRIKPSILLTASARLFFNDDAMDGSYFAFKLRYARENVAIMDIAPNSSSVQRLSDQWFDESYRSFDIIAQYGYQVLYDRLTTEYFVGLGARFTKESRQDLGYLGGIVTNNLLEVSTTLPRIEAGIRIGFQL